MPTSTSPTFIGIMSLAYFHAMPLTLLCTMSLTLLCTMSLTLLCTMSLTLLCTMSLTHLLLTAHISGTVDMHAVLYAWTLHSACVPYTLHTVHSTLHVCCVLYAVCTAHGIHCIHYTCILYTTFSFPLYYTDHVRQTCISCTLHTYCMHYRCMPCTTLLSYHLHVYVFCRCYVFAKCFHLLLPFHSIVSSSVLKATVINAMECRRLNTSALGSGVNGRRHLLFQCHRPMGDCRADFYAWCQCSVRMVSVFLLCTQASD